MAEIGSVLGGRYRLIELLGQGGMATIYRARDNQLERDVAVKVLRTEYGRDPDFLSRFRQEAQAAASLNHPNITAVFDYGQDPVGPFIVMELVDGEDLAKILRDNGPLPPRQAARLTAEVARALAAAHARGIVHRDVKPGNVMVARDGRVKVADFGIARAVAEAQMTLPGTTLGSVHYFSPEQARGETTTVASDVYSLGIVLYELLTGRRPWTGDSAASIAMARLSGDVPSPAAARGGIPADLDAITQRALAPDPAERFESAAAMAAALDDAVGSGGRQDASARLAGAGGVAAAGLGAAGAGGGIAAAGAAGAPSGPPTIASGVARPNPSRIPYSPDAYADGTPAGEAAPPRPAPNRARRVERYEEPEEERGTSPWVWISALLALAILVAAGFLVFQLLSGSTPPPVEPVRVPGFIGLTLDQAEQRAEENDLEVVQAATEERTDVDEGTVVAQDPPEGREVDPGSTVRLTIARAPGSVAVPDLRNLTEPEAVARLQEAGLTFGGRTEEFDPIVEAGRIIRSDPGANLMVARGSPVTYIVSRGPEPTPSPTPEPTPTPTPEPTPTPTPAPTPPPTAPPTDPPTDPPTEEPG